MALLKYHSMAGGPVGDLVDLGGFYKRLSITATAATWVRAQLLAPTDTAPSAPVATPAPAAGGESADGWVKMAASGLLELPPDPLGLKGYRYVEIWELNSGDMQIEGDF